MFLSIAGNPSNAEGHVTALPMDEINDLVQQLTADDGEWTYQATPAEDGQSFVAVYDEDGEFVGCL